MKIYIVKMSEGSHLTDNYHDGGSVAIIAEDIIHAKQLLSEYDNGDKYDERHPIVEKGNWKDAHIFELRDDYPSQILIFENAGCC